jgi:DNA-binding CsgD family transcriptional regulator
MTLGHAAQATRLRFLPVACTITSEAADVPGLQRAFPGATHLLFQNAGDPGADDLDPDVPVLMLDMPGAAFAEAVRIAVERATALAGDRSHDAPDGADDPEGDEDDAPGEATRRRLSAREREVLAGIRRGLPNKLIADELALSENTVKIYVRNVMRKMGVTNRTMAALACAPARAAGAVTSPSIPRLS